MSARELAVVLLVGHVSSVILVSLVVRKQLRIFKGTPDKSLRAGRITLTALALTVLIGNFVPIIIDSLVLIGPVKRAHPSPVGVVYATSNVIILLLSAMCVLALYIVAERLLKKEPL